MYKIALTGGIGTGKSYLSKHFIEMGIPVFYADDEAKKIYREETFITALCREFGPEVLLMDGQVNLRRLSQFVFNDAQLLQKLNRMVHPWVMQQFEQWVARQVSSAVIMESAIIYEAHLEHHFDKVIVVDAPLELRIRRILKRNPELTQEEILQRMSNQLPQEEKCCRADLVICTGETYQEGLLLD